MGLTPHQFYSMTRAEFILMMRGFDRAKDKEWEHTRLIAHTTASTVSTRKHPIKKIREWLPLRIDKNSKQELDNAEMRDKWQKLKANESSTTGKN